MFPDDGLNVFPFSLFSWDQPGIAHRWRRQALVDHPGSGADGSQGCGLAGTYKTDDENQFARFIDFYLSLYNHSVTSVFFTVFCSQ